MDVAGSEVAAAVADAHRREWSFVLASTARVAPDLATAEEAVQDAYAAALSTWGARGVPANPAAWLTTVARRRALDLRRRADVARRALPDLAADAPAEQVEGGTFPDERLRLVFTCCHPALAEEAQVALTLRLVCGLSTREIARAFLVRESAMAARITRAKHKIAAARIPYRVPDEDELPVRLDAVLAVVHLVYTAGHTAPLGASLVQRGLTERGLELATMLRRLLPGHADVAGLLALLLLTDARRPARVDGEGLPVMLADQDRSRWDRELIVPGLALLGSALRAGVAPGRFTLMAAIAAVHDESPAWGATDWPQVLGLYDLLAAVWPSPVVELNRAIAVGFTAGPAAGLAELDRLAAEPQLATYPYLAAARADFLRRLGRTDEARTAYQEAILLTGNDAERAHLERRLAAG